MENKGVKLCIFCGKPVEDPTMDVCKADASKAMQAMGKKGGTTTKERHGKEHYEKIGRLGGQKVKELVERGKKGLVEEKDAKP